MSLRNRTFLVLSLSALALLVACGSNGNGSSGTVTPPPTGGFANSNLSGTYVFAFSGTDVTNNSFFSMAGTFSANGNGGITGGSIDLIEPGLTTTVNQAVAVQSNSGYAITSDGRGKGTLVTSQFGTIGIDFVLSSSSHGMIIRFDNAGTGSGTFDLQDNSVTQADLTSYAFSLSGVSSSAVFASVGNLTLNGGTAVTGLQDFNDNKNPVGLTSLTLGGSLTLGASGAVGTASLAAAGSPYGALNFDVWAIDKTHLKLIETDGTHWTVGDAYTEQPTVGAGQIVYTAAGVDNSNPAGLFGIGGFMTYDGTSVISNGLEDMNDSGAGAQSLTVSGTMTAAGTGRYSLSLNGLYNGVSGGVGNYTFAAYPFVSGGTTGIFLLEIDVNGETGGTAFLQTAQTFASGSGYGLNLTGANGSGEVDAVAEFTATSGTLSNGVIDENDNGNDGFKLALGSGGTYTYDSPATGRGVLNYPTTQTAIGALDLAFYVVDGSTVIFMEGDSTQVATGAFATQSTPTAKAGLTHAQEYFSVLKAASKMKERSKN